MKVACTACGKTMRVKSSIDLVGKALCSCGKGRYEYAGPDDVPPIRPLEIKETVHDVVYRVPEATPKFWKCVQLAGFAGIVLSIIAFVVWSMALNPSSPMGVLVALFAMVILVAGFTSLFLGVIGAWWFHG